MLTGSNNKFYVQLKEQKMKNAIETSTKNIIDLISDIDSGKLKLPDFQRQYNWGKGKVKKLMDTIQKKHPSGSLLFIASNPNNPIVTERCFEEALNPEEKTEFLVLDGQQRLTSCYQVYHNKGTRSYYLNLKVLFKLYKENELDDADLDEDKIIEDRKHKNIPDGELNDDLFPMGCFHDKSEFKSVLTKYKKTIRDKDSEYFAFIDEKFELFCDNFFDYQFAVIKLPNDLTLDAVCKVFQTINTTALKLSAYDICVAKFMRYNINLKQKTDDAILEYHNIKIIAEKDKTIILQTVALLSNISPKMNNLANNLDTTSFTKWSRAIKGLNKTLDLLTTFGVGCDESLSLLPYQPFIALFGAVLPEVDYWDLKTAERSAVDEKLKQFFYFASLSGRYNEGTDNKMKEDYILLRRWIINGDIIPYMTHGIDWNRDKMKTAKKGSAMGKIILCLLNSCSPKDFCDNQTVGIGNNRAQSDIHHIFPKAAYPNIDKDLIESVFNQTFITSDSNKSIRDKTTDKYLSEIKEKIKSEESLKSRLKEHFISSEAYTAMLNQDYSSFINEREGRIRQYLEVDVGLSINLIDNGAADVDVDDDSFIDTEE